VPLANLAGGNLTQAFQTTRKGVVIAGPATKIREVPSDTSGPATLIGLVETNEGTIANSMLERKYNFNMVSPFVPASIVTITTFTP
jgi:hypothetical protein